MEISMGHNNLQDILESLELDKKDEKLNKEIFSSFETQMAILAGLFITYKTLPDQCSILIARIIAYMIAELAKYKFNKLRNQDPAFSKRNFN